METQVRAAVLAGILTWFILAMPSAAAGGQFDATFAAAGTTTLEGKLNLDWDAAGLSIGPAAANTTGQLLLGGHHLTFRLVTIPQDVVILNPPVLQSIHADQPSPEQDGPVKEAAAIEVRFDRPSVFQEVRLLPLGKSFPILGLRLEGLRVEPAGTRPVDVPDSPFTDEPQIDGVLSYAVPPFFSTPIHGWRTANITGAVALVAGPTVLLPDGTHLRTGRELNLSRSAIDPVTRSGRYAYDNRFLEVRGEPMQLSSTDLEATVSARKMDGHLDGHGSWHGIKGSSALANSTLPPAQDTLDTAGSLEVHATSNDQGTSWHVEGEASALSVDLVAWLEPSALAGGTAVGVGLLAYLLATQLRSALTFVLGRTTPGILKARPLGSRTRKAILNVIHEQQPITLVHLQERTGLARGTLRYHLRVLSSCELLQVLPPADGVERNMMYMLNSNSLLFDTQGIAEPGQGAAPIKPGKVLAAVNSSPVRRAVYDFLLRHGPADFDAIRAHILLHGFAASWPQSTASHQLRQLEDAQAIVATWQNRRKVYAANLDPQDARVQQYAHYLQSNGVAWLARRLHAEGPLTLDKLWRTSAGAVSSRRQLRHQLEQLTATVLLAYDPTTKEYRLERPLDSLAPHILERLNTA